MSGLDLFRVSSPGGAGFTVARQYGPRFEALLLDLERAGYRIDPDQSGGYANRNIAPSRTGGRAVQSKHARGEAIDINWRYNAVGRPGSIPSDTARAAAADYGMKWGGDWRGFMRDDMHFEVDPAARGAEARALLAQPTGDRLDARDDYDRTHRLPSSYGGRPSGMPNAFTAPQAGPSPTAPSGAHAPAAPAIRPAPMDAPDAHLPTMPRPSPAAVAGGSRQPDASSAMFDAFAEAEALLKPKAQPAAARADFSALANLRLAPWRPGRG